MSETPCKHEKTEAVLNVNHLEDTGGYMADLRITCAQCGEPFRFIGLPCGVDMTGAAVSIDGTEGRFAILPKSKSLSELEGTPIGFTVRKTQ